MTLRRADKKRVTADWHSVLPEFEMYRPLQLVRRFGPLVQTVVLLESHSSAEYEPMMTIASLLPSEDDDPLSVLELSFGPVKRVGFPPVTVKMQRHEELWRETVQLMVDQSPLPLSGPISLEATLDASIGVDSEGLWPRVMSCLGGEFNHLGPPLAEYLELLVLAPAAVGLPSLADVWFQRLEDLSLEFLEPVEKLVDDDWALVADTGEKRDAWFAGLRAQCADAPHLAALVEQRAIDVGLGEFTNHRFTELVE